VIGFDLDHNRLAAGRRAGLDLRTGGADSFGTISRQTDLVLLSHMLEHMHDVDQTLKMIRGGLRRDSYLYIEVPGIAGLVKPKDKCSVIDGYQASNDFLGYLQFEHNYCFELSTLTAFAERNGLRRIAGDEIVRALFVPTENAAPCRPLEKKGDVVVARLRTVERDYLSRNPFYKRILRRLYYAAKSLV
jgi:hypothetical protein